MIEILKAILFGIVEGITEWLPVSSTGHMILLDEFIQLNVTDEFYSMFQVVIQLGAILAVVVIFWNDIWPFGRRGNRQPMRYSGLLSYVKMDKIILWIKILIACIPAAIIGILFDEQLEELFYNYQTVSIALIVFGIAFIVIENHNKYARPKINSIAEIGYDTALLIGLFQLIAAIFPGTSRSGATIIGALLLGVSRTVAAEFTFYLAIPVMFGASLLKIVKFGFAFTMQEAIILIVGMLVAFVVSILIIQFLLSYIKKHDFKIFGWYRIVLGIIVLVYFIFIH
ncbi:MAG: undecaprenyl-diphosphate phosphatase [Erysipelotrichaceae bacterium]|nr:undecaprenyl-diphosphate phosphatase [Erysipelotrichaceae bacterium]